MEKREMEKALNAYNPYFEELRRVSKAHDDYIDSLEQEKIEIIEKYGYDSPEMMNWYDVMAAAKEAKPYTDGARKAYWAWIKSVDNENEDVEMNDFLWDREVEDFVETLRAAGFDAFIYTNQSTSVMENVHAFEKYDCRLEGTATISRIEKYCGKLRTETIPGLWIRL